MRQGRPTRSVVRENIIEILSNLKEGYGYQIYKEYLQHYPKTTLRNIYYHLKKGVLLKELEIAKKDKLQKPNSWGADTEVTFYKLSINTKLRRETHV